MIHIRYVVNWNLDPPKPEVLNVVFSLFYSVLAGKIWGATSSYVTYIPFYQSSIIRRCIVWIVLNAYFQSPLESFSLAERNLWKTWRSQIVRCWDSSASINIKCADGEEFKGLVFRLMWFVYGPRYADESFKFKIVYEKFICNSLLLFKVFRIVNMLIFVMKRRIPRYYCISFVFRQPGFCNKRVFLKAAETSVNFKWKTSSKTWYLQESISHLCCYDESFKSG